MFTPDDVTALAVTLKLAGISTLILLLIGTPLAWWLANTRCRLKVMIDAVVALPLILPPTVMGFYLLVALGPNGPLGHLMQSMGGETLAFTFTGLVIGSVVYSLPFVVQPLQDAFANIGSRYMEVAATLRAAPLDRFFTVAVPLARHGYLTAMVLGFAHTVGEFGVVLMIGGSIPGETRVLSIAIYDHVESLEYGHAYTLSGALLLMSFLLLLTLYSVKRRYRINRA